jgi:hypothetical protein
MTMLLLLTGFWLGIGSSLTVFLLFAAWLYGRHQMAIEDAEADAYDRGIEDGLRGASELVEVGRPGRG